MKKIGLLISIVLLSIVFSFLMMNFWLHQKMNDVKQSVLAKNTEIEKIEIINRIGGWGEWFSEYTLIVIINDQKYRIWVNGAGEVTDREFTERK